jgi:signal transduction histidine kinase
VKLALEDAIARIKKEERRPEQPSDEHLDVAPEVRSQIYGQAVEWVTGALLHEIASPVGLALLSAKRELGTAWEESTTRRHLETVRRIFGAIEKLKTAAGAPRPQEFDLAALVGEVVEADIGGNSERISLIGPKPFMITSDPALIRLAISNGARNAIESILSVGATEEDHAVIINWGHTDRDVWVSILDRGGGIVGPVEAAFDIGRSTKHNHSGFGLAIARRAIETLAGEVTLNSASGGGAVYEARWAK